MQNKKINYIFCDPENLRFKWQEENYIRNLIDIGVEPERIIVLNTIGEEDNSKEIFDLFGVKTYKYVDNREYEGRYYPASIKPWLLYHYFSYHPEKVDEIFFYTDSDIILHHEPTIPDDLSNNIMYGSDCNSYLGIDYLNSKNYTGSNLVSEMAKVYDIDVDWVEKYGKDSNIGAQYLMTGIPANYWRDVYYYSIDLKKYFDYIEERYKDKYKEEKRDDEIVVQKWCAEMWATLWTMSKYNIVPKISKELSFAWATWKSTDWTSGEYNILHNAGVIKDIAKKDHLFYKGDYITKSPYPRIDRILKKVDDTTASYMYVQELKKTEEFIKNA